MVRNTFSWLSNSFDLGEVNRVLNVDVLCIGRLLFL